MSIRGLRARLTYANVMSTVAALLALTGAATAIAFSLPKNSVKSKHIAPGAVKTSDIGKDAATGDKVKESTLGKVPSAAFADNAGHAAGADHASTADTASVANTLAGGLMPANISKTLTTSSAFFTESLELKVSGYGLFFIQCDTNTGSATDDEAIFGYQNSLGSNAIEGGFGITQPFPYGATEANVIAGTEPGFATFVNQDRRLYYHYSLALPGTSKAVVVEASGFDNEANSGCAGQIQAFVAS